MIMLFLRGLLNFKVVFFVENYFLRKVSGMRLDPSIKVVDFKMVMLLTEIPRHSLVPSLSKSLERIRLFDS